MLFLVNNKQGHARQKHETHRYTQLSLELLSKENFEQKLGGGVGRGTIHRPFGIPANPESTVGLDTPLCKLCWDEQVKGKFSLLVSFMYDEWVD